MMRSLTIAAALLSVVLLSPVTPCLAAAPAHQTQAVHKAPVHHHKATKAKRHKAHHHRATTHRLHHVHPRPQSTTHR